MRKKILLNINTSFEYAPFGDKIWATNRYSHRQYFLEKLCSLEDWVLYPGPF